MSSLHIISSNATGTHHEVRSIAYKFEKLPFEKVIIHAPSQMKNPEDLN